MFMPVPTPAKACRNPAEMRRASFSWLINGACKQKILTTSVLSIIASFSGCQFVQKPMCIIFTFTRILTIFLELVKNGISDLLILGFVPNWAKESKYPNFSQKEKFRKISVIEVKPFCLFQHFQSKQTFPHSLIEMFNFSLPTWNENSLFRVRLMLISASTQASAVFHGNCSFKSIQNETFHLGFLCGNCTKISVFFPLQKILILTKLVFFNRKLFD